VRVLATLALVAALVAVALVVTNSLGGTDDEGGKKRKDDAQVAGCKPEFENAVENGFYIVQQDDLLSLIAQRTCVDDEELSRLNPDVDPQALAPGQCISLEEKGCESSGSGT
jgi:LysM repeat protein